MKSRISQISKHGVMTFMVGSLILFILALPNLSRAQSNLKVEILPRIVTSQPFTFSITVEVQPDINSLYSFSLLLNGVDITFGLIVPALKSPNSGIASFPDASTLKFAVPGVSLPNGTYKIDVKVATPTGQKASDSVTYTIGAVPPPATVSFAQDIKPIFDANCALSGCHTNSDLAMNMTLENPFDPVFGEVGVPSIEVPGMLRIAPGNPSQSYLVYKIKGTQATVGGTGAQMPLGGAPLSAADIQLIETWIAQGAQNN